MSCHDELYMGKLNLIVENGRDSVSFEGLPRNVGLFGSFDALWAASVMEANRDPEKGNEMKVRAHVTEEEVRVIAGKANKEFLSLIIVSVAKAEKLPSIQCKLPTKAFAADRKACCLGEFKILDDVVEQFLGKVK